MGIKSTFFSVVRRNKRGPTIDTQGARTCRPNPFTPKSNFNSPYYKQYNSYNVSSENLVLDQFIIPKLIFFFILISYLVDIVLIL